MPAYPPIPQRFLEAVDRYGQPRALLYKSGGEWRAVASHELLRQVAGLAAALAEMGISTGDRVGLFSTNRPEWHVADLAILGLGAVNVPLYFNESAERMVYLLNDSGARAVVVAGADIARKLVSVRGNLKTVEQIILAGAPGEGGEDVLRYETLVAAAGEAQIAEYRRRAALLTSDQLASLIYTSGTTGVPKGVMLTHANLASNEMDSFSASDHKMGDVGLSFLPLAHVYERVIDYGYLFRGITVAYVEKLEDLPQALKEVRPTVMAAVPRVFEKAYANIQARASQASPQRKRIFDWAMQVARAALPWKGYGRHVSLKVKLQWWLADVLVYSRIRAGMGGRLRSVVSGSAPLAKPLLEFFCSVGVPIYQGYGLTETSPVVTSSTPEHNRLGTVGRPIANVEVRIAEDGEILVRGPNVMRGYYKMPAETAEILSGEGWLRTGDIGQLDAEGFLTITDRKKDLIKTAAGKFVAPQPIENHLKMQPLIQSAVVIGDRRRFIAALLVPNFAAVEARGRAEGIAFTSAREMAAHPKVRAWVAAQVEQVNANLAQYETIKRFALLDREFTLDAGELTVTMKLKRRAIEEKYAEQVEQIYAEDGGSQKPEVRIPRP